MSSPIWQKNKTAVIDDIIMDFMAGEDIVLDRELIQYDIQASIAHVKNLASINLLSVDESNALISKLSELSQQVDTTFLPIFLLCVYKSMANFNLSYICMDSAV